MLDIDAFMQHVRDRDFTIEDRGVVSGVRRFFISQQGHRVAYFDIDELVWPDVSQEWLLRQVDIIMDEWKPIEEQ